MDPESNVNMPLELLSLFCKLVIMAHDPPPRLLIFGRVGVFRLTQPEGMKLIQECKLKGFHQHPDDITIYEQADLTWAPVRMTIVDLRR